MYKPLTPYEREQAEEYARHGYGERTMEHKAAPCRRPLFRRILERLECYVAIVFVAVFMGCVVFAMIISSAFKKERDAMSQNDSNDAKTSNNDER